MEATKHNNIISLGFTPEKIYKNDSIHYKQIVNFAQENNFEVFELGLNPSIIGESFLILKHNEKSLTVSFVLNGADSFKGYVYECIYSDYLININY
jgi:hypothetical protein